jgi:uncharacterized protein
MPASATARSHHAPNDLRQSAVGNLERSKAFYDALGFTINPQFSDDTAACVVISDTFFLIILTHQKFDFFATQPRADTTKTSSCLIALSRDSREGVDSITAAALNAGGHEPKPAMDLGFMYNRIFTDPDGHVFEPMWMDPAPMQSQ